MEPRRLPSVPSARATPLLKKRRGCEAAKKRMTLMMRLDDVQVAQRIKSCPTGSGWKPLIGCSRQRNHHPLPSCATLTAIPQIEALGDSGNSTSSRCPRVQEREGSDKQRKRGNECRQTRRHRSERGRPTFKLDKCSTCKASPCAAVTEHSSLVPLVRHNLIATAKNTPRIVAAIGFISVQCGRMDIALEKKRR